MTTQRSTRFMREIADGYVEDIRRRIRDVNSDPMFCYRVTRAVIFGSYVNDLEMQTLGDLDLALKLEPKYEGEEMEHYESLSRGRHRTRDWMAAMLWPQEEVLRYVRNRRSYVSVHMIGGSDDEAIFSKRWLEMDISPDGSEDVLRP